MKHESSLFPGIALATFGVLLTAYLIVISWPQPVLDAFGFRQTQTAISAYWMLKGGPWLAYETPVAGYPWSIPFELPLYQWLVAGLSGLLGLSIDHSGRLVGAFFLMCSAALVYATAMSIRRDRSLALLCAGALLCSPLMAFWSRAVMIESTALFFSLGFVWTMAEYARTRLPRWALLAATFATLAAMVKVTTFFGFAVVVCCGLMWMWFRGRHEEGHGPKLLVTALAGAAVLASMVVLKLWLHMGDELKSRTVWGQALASSELGDWNYGTLAQRLDAGFWKDIAFGRSLLDGFGSITLFMVAVVVVLASRRTRVAGVILLVGYVAPFLVFTNLHYVHDYYQAANIAFATTLVALAVWSIGQRASGGRHLAAFATLVICAFSWNRVDRHFAPMIRQDMANTPTMQLVRHLRQATVPGSALLLMGLDWASDVPYYAERKALMLPNWVPPDLLRRAEDRSRAFGGADVAAVVVCKNGLGDDPAKLAVFQSLTRIYTTGLRHSVVAGCDVYDQG